MWRPQTTTKGMRSILRILPTWACAVAALVLAGCAKFGGSALVFVPAKLPSCQGPLISVRVRWNVEADTSGPVRIYVSSPGESRKLWIVAATRGEQETGRWMHDGSTITLTNLKGRVLAVRTLETESCKKSGQG